MSQVWHLFRNDLRASKYILAVWYGSLAAYAACAFQDPLTSAWTGYGSIVGMMTTVVAVVCAALLVQQDSLVGPRAFWMTRPINRWSLLASKTLFVLVVFVASHVALCAAILLRFDLSASDLPTMLARGGWQWTVYLALGMVVATVTTGAAQFIVASLGLYFVTISGCIAVSIAADTDPSSGHFGPAWPSAAILLLGAALIVWRYRGGSRLQTLGIGLCGALAIVLLARFGILGRTDDSHQRAPLTSATRWGVADLREDAWLHYGDFALRIKSIQADAVEATIVVVQRWIGSEISSRVWPELKVFHPPTGKSFEPSGRSSSGDGSMRWIGGWPVVAHHQWSIQVFWDRQPPEIRRLGPAALVDAQLVVTGR